MGGREKGEVPAVRKTVAIVRYLNGKAPGGATLRETAGDLAITNSHCHNILRTLIHHDWVGYDAASRRYKLQPGLCEDALSVLNKFEPLARLRPLVAQLAITVRVTCILSQLEPDGSFLVLDTATGTNGLGLTVPIGHRFDPDAPVQRKAALAWQSEEAIEAWLRCWAPIRRTSATITDRATLLKDLATTRARGYAISREEAVVGVTSVGLPIFDWTANPAMVLQCPAFTDSIVAPGREREVATALQQAITRAHALLGSRVPASFRFPSGG